ncbi:hypothetical protein [Amycolatopsis anabasis]|uniref:hypothetical protein n=1 Tax=Amycolatopsis anabasis TaxID=1840409 RepID=UPI00131BA98A|nr:hypothetical protein [Amycolatopsis anabasis]
MFWLFGQIWLWLLIAFTLGAALTGFLLTAAGRRRTAPVAAEPEDTQRFTAARRWPEEPSPDEPYDQEAETGYEIKSGDLGHREGTLPTNEIPRAELDEPPIANGTPRWPRDEDWPPAEQERVPGSDRFGNRT